MDTRSIIYAIWGAAAWIQGTLWLEAGHEIASYGADAAAFILLVVALVRARGR